MQSTSDKHHEIFMTTPSICLKPIASLTKSDCAYDLRKAKNMQYLKGQ
jgi:hypothetical protein